MSGLTFVVPGLTVKGRGGPGDPWNLYYVFSDSWRLIDSSIHRIIEALILGSSGVVVEAKISVLGSFCTLPTAFFFLYSLP